jgi:lycopene cyclase domain-containing protein
MRYTYLLIDVLSVLVPFVFSFHPRLKFYKHWPAFLPALLITAIVFTGWDIYFTRLKIWGFNPVYLTGVNVFNLPVEEVLFFFCIPYACVFTYCSLKTIIKTSISIKAGQTITLALMVACILLSIIFRNLHYTAYTFAVLAGLLLVAQYVLKVSWLSRFYFTYLILLFPFFLVNGMLTGTGLAAPVVWYNPSAMLNIRILTIPIEDIFYGMDLILLNVLIFSWLSERKRQQLQVTNKNISIHYLTN